VSRYINNSAKATSQKRAKLTSALLILPSPIATAKHCPFLKTTPHHRKGAVSINNKTYLAKLKLKDIKLYTKEKKEKNQTRFDFDVYSDGFIRDKRFSEFPQVEQDYC